MNRHVRNAQIIAMAKQGVRPRDLALHFRITAEHVQNLLGRARKRGEDIPRYSSSGEIVSGYAVVGEAKVTSVLLPINAMTALAPYAHRRDMSVPELAAKIIQIVADEDLVLAVLDDGIAERPFG